MPIDLKDAFKAARQNDVNRVRKALKLFVVDTSDDAGRTLLHHASMALAEDVVNLLLTEYSANPLQEDKSGESPFVALFKAWNLGAEDKLSLNESALAVANALTDHSSPFTEESEISNWPRDPATGLAMSPSKLRKYFPGFLESEDESEEVTLQTSLAPKPRVAPTL